MSDDTAESRITLHERETARGLELHAVQDALMMAGYSASLASQSPAACIRALHQNATKQDWRDVFLAAVAGGCNVHTAKAQADIGAKMLAEQRVRGVE